MKRTITIFIIIVLLYGLILTSCRIVLTSAAKAWEYDPVYSIPAAISRTGGVAPLSVHFCAEISANASDYHNLDYTWDFGDQSSGIWSTTSNPKNESKGAVAAHVYETAGTYTISLVVRDSSGIVGSNTFSVEVEDPDLFYAGERTVCVSSSGNFNGAPDGSLQLTISDLATVTSYATAGRRILFSRGDSWTTGALTWPNNSGPVTIGAYGEISYINEYGLAENAPRITVTEGSFLPLSNKQNWRIMDIHLIDTTQQFGSIGGDIAVQHILQLRLEVEGFNVGLGWSHWNDPDGDIQGDEMAVVSCFAYGSGTNIAYVGGERLVLLGNTFTDASLSHVLRVWQAYLGVISNNVISGSSTESSTGRLALKMHGPSQEEISADDWSHLRERTQFSIVSDNIIGASRPYVVSIAPQDNGSDERVSHIIFERNEYHYDYGTPSTESVALDTVIYADGRDLTFRNNLFDATGEGRYFTCIRVAPNDLTPTSRGIRIYNNTVFKPVVSENPQGWVAFSFTDDVEDAHIFNNLVSFVGDINGQSLISAPDSMELEQASNILTDAAGFIDADNFLPLSRDFRLISGAEAIDAGVDMPVLEDIAGNNRSGGSYDIGAYEN
jgi:PKD repeat protein